MSRLFFDFILVVQAGWKITGIPVINELSMRLTMRWIIFMIIILPLICSCSKKPLETKRFFRDEKAVQTMWKLAARVASSEEIVGTWISEKSDLPKGFDVKSYAMSFGKDGGGSFSQETKDGTTGLPFDYQIKQSKLYGSTAGPPLSEWGEIRKYKMLMLNKTNNGIFVFRKATSN